MDFLAQHLAVVLSGIGAVFLAVLGAYLKYFFDRKLEDGKKKQATQSIASGDNSNNNQAGRDLNING